MGVSSQLGNSCCRKSAKAPDPQGLKGNKCGANRSITYPVRTSSGNPTLKKSPLACHVCAFVGTGTAELTLPIGRGPLRSYGVFSAPAGFSPSCGRSEATALCRWNSKNLDHRYAARVFRRTDSWFYSRPAIRHQWPGRLRENPTFPPYHLGRFQNLWRAGSPRGKSRTFLPWKSKSRCLPSGPRCCRPASAQQKNLRLECREGLIPLR